MHCILSVPPARKGFRTLVPLTFSAYFGVTNTSRIFDPSFLNTLYIHIYIYSFIIYKLKEINVLLQKFQDSLFHGKFGVSEEDKE